MSLENDVGAMLIFIKENNERGTEESTAKKIYEVIKKHGVHNVIWNLKDRSRSPLIVWTINLISEAAIGAMAEEQNKEN